MSHNIIHKTETTKQYTIQLRSLRHLNNNNTSTQSRCVNNINFKSV